VTDGKRPAGIPIGRALEIPSGIVYDDLRDVVAVIGRVHGDGRLPRIPVRLMSGVAEFGRFRFDVGTGESIGISINPFQPHRAFALLHEIGHFLDWQSLGDGRDFGSTSNPLLLNWLQATKQSRAGRVLNEIVRKGTADTHGDDAPRQLLTADDLVALRLVLLPEEFWARSYAQYIATKVSRLALRESLTTLRHRHPGRVYYPIQWDDDDFRPIADTIDDLFERLGWRQ
jgi:hypothetical protein